MEVVDAPPLEAFKTRLDGAYPMVGNPSHGGGIGTQVGWGLPRGWQPFP